MAATSGFLLSAAWMLSKEARWRTPLTAIPLSSYPISTALQMLQNPLTWKEFPDRRELQVGETRPTDASSPGLETLNPGYGGGGAGRAVWYLSPGYMRIWGTMPGNARHLAAGG